MKNKIGHLPINTLSYEDISVTKAVPGSGKKHVIAAYKHLQMATAWAHRWHKSGNN